MNSYKYDTHVHTSETSRCGNVSSRELVDLYKKAGYEGVVITDHYYKHYFEEMDSKSWEEKVDTFLKGYRNALEAGAKVGLNVLLGMEIRFVSGPNDYLVYGIDRDFLLENEKLYELDLQSFRSLTEGRGIMVYQAHPFRPTMTRSCSPLIDGIEVYNGNLRHNSSNHLAFEYAKAKGLKIISGSDFHEFEDLARGGIAITERLNTSEELVQLLCSEENPQLVMT